MPTATTLHLPNGQTLSVSPVFGGLAFKSNQLDVHHSTFPPGWTIILQTDDEPGEDGKREHRHSKSHSEGDLSEKHKEAHAHRFTKPTLQNDWLFFSSISMPSSSDFKPSSSPTRQIAMMLWATLWWYFHQPAPDPHVVTEASSTTPEGGRPKADWRIRVKKEGIFKGKNLIQKLERMGLIASEDSYVGTDTDVRNPAGWSDMFVSRKVFWQIDPRIFLFSLSPTSTSPFPVSGSPYPSRPGSPARGTGMESPRPDVGAQPQITQQMEALNTGHASPGGPYASGSHLPTYYPPAPPQYIFSNHIRHPIRPKPPRPGETFYTRFVPSVEQYLSFRVPSLSSRPPPQFGHIGGSATSVLPSHPGAAAAMTFPTLSSLSGRSSDLEMLHKWMNDPRVEAAWGVSGPISTQQKFLEDGMSSKHSFPAIGCWDGKPFGYFEIYWVKEDRMGRLLGGHIDDYTRGLHCLVGEQEFRGAHRVRIWLSALVHFCWLADPRTTTIMLEPRVDNAKFIGYLQDAGFHKDGEVTFPHKQSAIMKIRRETWESPAL